MSAPALSTSAPRPRRRLRFWLSLLLIVVAAITLTVNAGGSIQAALDRAEPGDTIEVRPGVYREALLLDHDNITLRGLIENGQRAILEDDNKLRDALITSSHSFTIEGFQVQNYTANGLTVHGARNVTFRDLNRSARHHYSPRASASA
ncbi:MAG TPA: hypothetical protein VNQ79_27325 [Blastocatellia bacterium]|nr:hypothetical protein [Blastocatellia bacterium]